MDGGSGVAGSVLPPAPGPGPVLQHHQAAISENVTKTHLYKKSSGRTVRIKVSVSQPAASSEDQETQEDGARQAAGAHSRLCTQDWSFVWIDMDFLLVSRSGELSGNVDCSLSWWLLIL